MYQILILSGIFCGAVLFSYLIFFIFDRMHLMLDPKYRIARKLNETVAKQFTLSRKALINLYDLYQGLKRDVPKPDAAFLKTVRPDCEKILHQIMLDVTENQRMIDQMQVRAQMDPKILNQVALKRWRRDQVEILRMNRLLGDQLLTYFNHHLALPKYPVAIERFLQNTKG